MKPDFIRYEEDNGVPAPKPWDFNDPGGFLAAQEHTAKDPWLQQ
jgi:hypothetical protein